MSTTSEYRRQSVGDGNVRSQRAWARVAGLMYWLVLVADLTGLQLHSITGKWLMFGGSLLTVPLALGLYYAVKPAGQVLAMIALSLRLLEAVIGLLSTAAGFVALGSKMTGSSFGRSILNFAHWNAATAFGALVFTIGSTIFFFLFVKSDYIPRVLAGLGLWASLIAMAACLIHLARPSFPAMAIYPWLPMLLAETSTGAWLLTKSVRVQTKPL